MTIYQYHDENKKLLYERVRKQPKAFLLRRPDGKGGFIYSLKQGWYLNGKRKWTLVGKDQSTRPSNKSALWFDEVPRVLYRLPELRAASESTPIYYLDGEKNVERAREFGLVATTAGSMTDWRDEFSAEFRNHPLIIIVKNNEEGRELAQRVIRASYFKASYVKILNLGGNVPGDYSNYDFSDWCDLGGDLERLLFMIKDTPESIPNKSTTSIISAKDLLKIDFPIPKFAVYGIIQEGVTILAGAPKIGKTWLALDISISVASDRSALGEHNVNQGDVLYLALEDGKRRVQERMRMILDGYNMAEAPDSLSISTEWPTLDNGGINELSKWLKEHPNARMIVIDTFKRIRARRISNRDVYGDDYDSVSPLADLAKEFRVAIVVVHHTNKLKSDDPVDLVSGSLGLSGAADAVLVFRRARGKADASLFITGRDLYEKELALKWEQASSCWTIIGNAMDFHISQERANIIRLLEEAGKPLSPKRIATDLNKRPGTIRKLLFNMVDDGQVKCIERGKYTVSSNSSNDGIKVTAVTTVTSTNGE